MPSQFLETQERVKLTNQILVSLYEFSGGTTRDRRVLLEQADLHKFLPGLNLDGIPRTIAGSIVSRLEEHGFLAERPNYHALGALLSYILELGELSQDDSAFVAGLIVKHGLVHDPNYLARLREQHNISEATDPVDESVTPLAKPDAVITTHEPSFEPVMEDQEGLEAIINSADNFLDIVGLAGAIYSAQAVGRIEIPEGTAHGTGFLIGPDLLLTNQHVLKNSGILSEAVIRFDYMQDLKGISPSSGRVFRFQPDFYHASLPGELDYALVKLDGEPLKDIAVGDELDSLAPLELLRQGKHRGYLVLAPRQLQHYSRVNIIQHPNGNPLKAVMTQNYVQRDMTETRVHYVADTMGGSSGSAVFNSQWEVVALHHSGAPYPPDPTLKKWKADFRVNEGIPMRAILKDFEAKGLMRHLPR